MDKKERLTKFDEGFRLGYGKGWDDAEKDRNAIPNAEEIIEAYRALAAARKDANALLSELNVLNVTIANIRVRLAELGEEA